jgi:hypothetical protein
LSFKGVEGDDLDCPYSVAVFSGQSAAVALPLVRFAPTSVRFHPRIDNRHSFTIHRRRFVFFWCSGCGTEFTYAPDCASTGITSLSHGNSGKKGRCGAPWHLASETVFPQRSCKERASDGGKTTPCRIGARRKWNTNIITPSLCAARTRFCVSEFVNKDVVDKQDAPGSQSALGRLLAALPLCHLIFQSRPVQNVRVGHTCAKSPTGMYGVGLAIRLAGIRDMLEERGEVPTPCQPPAS